jgi:hypothetical protein
MFFYVIQTCTLNGHLYNVTYTRCRIDTINSPYDGHMAAWNVQKIEINIHEKKIVCKVGYLQRLYNDLLDQIWHQLFISHKITGRV